MVDNINMYIEEGEIVGYLGPNGAGKSTTIKMLSGVLTPTSGELTVLGKEPSKNRKRTREEYRSTLWTKNTVMVGLTIKGFFLNY